MACDGRLPHPRLLEPGPPDSHARIGGRQAMTTASARRLDVVEIKISQVGGIFKTCTRRVRDVLRDVGEWVVGIVAIYVVGHAPMVTRSAHAVEWRWDVCRSTTAAQTKVWHVRTIARRGAGAPRDRQRPRWNWCPGPSRTRPSLRPRAENVGGCPYAPGLGRTRRGGVHGDLRPVRRSAESGVP